MGLDILDECSKHGVSGLKLCGYRSPLHGSRSGGCAPGLQSGKDLCRWMLGISCCSILSRSERFSACQKANIGSLQTFAIILGGISSVLWLLNWGFEGTDFDIYREGLTNSWESLKVCEDKACVPCFLLGKRQSFRNNTLKYNWKSVWR